jgi:hypothetical protein
VLTSPDADRLKDQMPHNSDHSGGPNPEEPNLEFADGDYLYEVSVSPAMLPLRLIHGSPTLNTFGEVVLYYALHVIVGLGSRLFDRRYKVLVSRKASRPSAGWTVVTAEFVDSPELAQARQVELLRTWKAGQFAEAWAIPGEDLRQARRSGERLVEVRKMS